MRAWPFAALFLFCATVPARASGLYEGHAIVTGTDDRQRPEGFSRCLREVLVKVSGDPSLAADPRIAAFDADAQTIAEDFDYQDRMSGQPEHDEQGTRDRPFDLAVRFAPARIDAILAQLGSAPWRAERPALGLQIAIEKNGARFALTADGFPDELIREAAIAAATKYGMRVVLPPHTASATSPAPLPDLPGAVAVRGTLVWSPKDYGWVGIWHLTWQQREHEWSIRGVSFDEALRDAVRGAMSVLAGHG